MSFHCRERCFSFTLRIESLSYTRIIENSIFISSILYKIVANSMQKDFFKLILYSMCIPLATAVCGGKMRVNVCNEVLERKHQCLSVLSIPSIYTYLTYPLSTHTTPTITPIPNYKELDLTPTILLCKYLQKTSSKSRKAGK